jgi:putative nucleotidyltransferase with HDIG domain
LACALIAEEVAATVRLDKETAYTAGITHDIGRMGLATAYPEPYARLLEEVQDTPERMLERERQLFSVDHCEAGEQLIREWSLPEEFVEAAAHHHRGRRSDQFDMLWLTQWSCAAADAIGFCASFPGVPQGRYEQLAHELEERGGIKFSIAAGDLAAKIADRITSVEP